MFPDYRAGGGPGQDGVFHTPERFADGGHCLVAGQLSARAGDELAQNYNLPEKDLARIRDLILSHEQEIRDAWNRHFGG